MNSEIPQEKAAFCYQEFFKLIIDSLTNEDYEFSIDFEGLAWDVYKFSIKVPTSSDQESKERRIFGQIIFRIGQAVNGSKDPFLWIRFVVGGRRSPEELIKTLQTLALTAATPSKGELLQ